jgi:hypothetical protein
MLHSAVKKITRFFLLATLAVVLVACSRVNQDNFDRIQTGMTQAEVKAILGTPTETSSINIGGLSGTASRWDGDNGSISVQFVNGEVQAMQYSRVQINK